MEEQFNASKQSNQMLKDWTFKAKLRDGSVIDSSVTPWQTLNKPEVRVLIEHLGLFYDGEYKGTVEFLGNEQRPILVRSVTVEVNSNEGSEISRTHEWLIGWQSTINGKNVKAILRLYLNGLFILGNSDGR